MHAHADLVGDGRQADRGTQGGGGDDVVTTRVSHVGQCVVLGAEGDDELTRSLHRAKGGLATSDPALQRESRTLGGLGHRLGALELLVADLGV